MAGNTTLVAIHLPRINSASALVDSNGRPTTITKTFLDALAAQAETAVNAIIDNINTTAAAQAAATAAQTAATAAASAAADAQASAGNVTGVTSLSGSYVSPTNILTAFDAGSSATIAVASHERVYGNGVSVAVDGGDLTGLNYSSSYCVYYDQASRAGGAVSYETTNDPATASSSDAQPDRHYVGAISTPAALGGNLTGIGAVAPNINLNLNFGFL